MRGQLLRTELFFTLTSPLHATASTIRLKAVL